MPKKQLKKAGHGDEKAGQRQILAKIGTVPLKAGTVGHIHLFSFMSFWRRNGSILSCLVNVHVYRSGGPHFHKSIGSGPTGIPMHGSLSLRSQHLNLPWSPKSHENGSLKYYEKKDPGSPPVHVITIVTPRACALRKGTRNNLAVCHSRKLPDRHI